MTPRCVLCDRPTGGLLEVVPVCQEHRTYGQVEEEMRAMRVALVSLEKQAVQEQKDFWQCRQCWSNGDLGADVWHKDSCAFIALARRVLGGERRQPIDTAGSKPGQSCTYAAGEPSVCVRCAATGWHWCQGEERQGE